MSCSGVGDDAHSYGFDGSRKCIWNSANQISFPCKKWAIGDRVGLLLDLDSVPNQCLMHVSLNGGHVGIMQTEDIGFGVHLVASLNHEQKLALVWSQSHMKHRPQGVPIFPLV
jgi:hypothetical protein